MSFRRGLSRVDRVSQWLQFARQWHIIDANQQDTSKLADKVANHLSGKYKPIWHPETDCGDHVVVVNCKDVAMHAFDWKHTLYHFDKQYPKARNDIPAYQIHEYDPCRIVFLSTYKALGNNLLRRRHIQRLHLFPDLEMPDFVKKNIGNQLEQVQPVIKRSDQYTAEERAAFPRLIKFDENHVVDWENSAQNPGRHAKPTIDYITATMEHIERVNLKASGEYSPVLKQLPRVSFNETPIEYSPNSTFDSDCADEDCFTPKLSSTRLPTPKSRRKFGVADITGGPFASWDSSLFSTLLEKSGQSENLSLDNYSNRYYNSPIVSFNETPINFTPIQDDDENCITPKIPANDVEIPKSKRKFGVANISVVSLSSMEANVSNITNLSND